MGTSRGGILTEAGLIWGILSEAAAHILQWAPMRRWDLGLGPAPQSHSCIQGAFSKVESAWEKKQLHLQQAVDVPSQGEQTLSLRLLFSF